MHYRLSHLISLLFLICFLVGGSALDAPAQSLEVEVEIECELYLRSQSYSHILDKKERVLVPFSPNLARQATNSLIDQVSVSSQIVNLKKGNSLYLLNSSFLI